MGETIRRLLEVFRGRVPDSESNSRVSDLASRPDKWSAGHKVFDEVRYRLLAAQRAKDRTKERQYSLEETCAQAMYNASNPEDPFDPGSPFFIAGLAISLGQVTGVPVDSIAAVLAPSA